MSTKVTKNTSKVPRPKGWGIDPVRLKNRLTVCIVMHTINAMEFTCNVIKNETNIRDRGLPLLAARAMFNPTMVIRKDTRKT
jgi:hypothetical protein